MVKKWGKTLAIGDGANDVNMIHSANVGVGVRGIEGSQATRAADYVITEFRLLKRLVIYHGLNNYHRNSNVVTYTLYKNMLLTFPNLFYGPISLESATYLYDPWVAQVFNLFFTGIPIIYYGIFDILYSYKEMKQKPSLYKEGQNCLYFNKTVLIRALLDPLLASILILYVVFYSTEFALCSRGYMIYKEWSGNLIFSIIVVACNIRIVIMSHQFNIVQGFITSMSVILYPILYLLVSVILATDSKNTLFHQFSTGLYWLLLVLVCFVNEGFKIVENNIVKMKK
jgi:phospholipid-transporting ATPase